MHRIRGGYLLLLLWLACSVLHPVYAVAAQAAGRAPLLDEIRVLARNDTPALAIRLLEQHQPSWEHSPGAWMQWERERIQLYRASGNWHAIIERLEHLPGVGGQPDTPPLPASFMHWAMEQRAGAHLQLGEAGQALVLLRRLLWGDAGATPGSGGDGDPLSRWRMLVIRAYMEVGQVEDAYTAMLRYRQDYPDQESQWLLPYARILIRTGRFREVEPLLAGHTSGEARVLLYQAQLEDGAVSGKEMRRKLVSLVKGSGIGHEDEYRMWALAARMARRMGDDESEISYLIKALTLAENTHLPADALPGVRGGDLWQVYQRYGKRLGNELQLLTGNHPAWIGRARKLRKREPVKAAALYAVLLHEIEDAALKAELHEEFAQLLAKEKHGFTLLQHLYLDEDGVGSGMQVQARDLPDGIRHRLVDDALARADIPLASRLMGDLEHAPQGSDVFQWKLRRARILIMGGQQQRGIEALYALLEDAQTVSRQQADRLVQVLFDLQAVDRHGEAVELFTRLLARVPEVAADSGDKAHDRDARWRREIYYWMADSCKAMGRYQDAARLYLRSAMWLGETTMDPWAQTARYQAADVLASAGLREDAAALYRALLKVTRDADRRTVLQSRLQQLWLRPQQADTPAPADRGVVDHAQQRFRQEDVW